MERGPLALFGAVVAVGLGPAMWLGVQFGSASITPGRPPAVTKVQQNEVVLPEGGAGAGENPADDPARIIRSDPKVPAGSLKSKPRATPTATPPSPAPSTRDDDDEDTGPSEAPSSTPPSGDPDTPGDPDTNDPSTPPTESTTDPDPDPDPTDGYPTDEPTDPDVPTTEVTTDVTADDPHPPAAA